MTVQKILVVDDELSIRLLVKDILTTHGYEVVEAENGEQAWQLLQSKKFDLMITDRSMPSLDGLDLLRRLQEAHQTIPTLMVSAYGEESLWVEALRLGADDYILKPFQTEVLLEKVQKKLASNPK